MRQRTAIALTAVSLCGGTAIAAIAPVIKARDEGRPAAVHALQAMMLRFLTGLPPGKVRFTIIDPVGLGDNFAAFMHLADFDEKLVTSQIWTEARDLIVDPFFVAGPQDIGLGWRVLTSLQRVAIGYGFADDHMNATILNAHHKSSAADVPRASIREGGS